MNNCVDCCHHKRQHGRAYWSWAETQSASRCFGFWEFLSSSYLISFLSSSSPLTFVIFMYPYSYPPSPPTSFHLSVLLVLCFLIPSLFYSPFIFYSSSFNSLFSFYPISSSSSSYLFPFTFIFSLLSFVQFIAFIHHIILSFLFPLFILF